MYRQSAQFLWALFTPREDLFFVDLKLRQEYLAHILTLNGHLHLLREINFDVNKLNKRGESCLQIAMQNRHYELCEFLITKKPRVSLFLSADHPIVKALEHNQYKLASNFLSLVNGELVPGEDKYTLLHHLFANYVSCREADKFLDTLIQSGLFGKTQTNMLTFQEETALDLSIILKTDAFHLAFKHISLFDFSIV